MLQWYISDVSTICHLLFVSADLFKADKQKYFMQQVVKLRVLLLQEIVEADHTSSFKSGQVHKYMVR